MIQITPFLWFDNNAEEAAAFYLSIFTQGRRLDELRVTEAGPGPIGSLLALDIELNGQVVTFLNGGPAQRLSEAFSFTVRCENQQEIDFYWDKLLEGGGQEIACGWLKDRFGVSWQVTPKDVFALVRYPSAMRAMMKMVKFNIAQLKAAAKQDLA